MKIDKFIDSWFTGRCLKHPVVVAVIFLLNWLRSGASMKQEDIIRMAREAGFTELEFYGNKLGTNPTECLERFAALVEEAENEACAKAVDHILKEGGGTWGDAIRARGQA
jgi:hypothetical protein